MSSHLIQKLASTWIEGSETPDFDQSILSRWRVSNPVWQSGSKQLQGTKLKKKNDGTMSGAIIAAAFAAKASGKPCFVWQGQSFMHEVWNATMSTAQPPAPFERISDTCLVVTPDLNYWRCDFKQKSEKTARKAKAS